jgi:alpha-L-fucosidase
VPRVLFIVPLFCLLFQNPARGADAPDRAAWMKSARFGVMNHYLADWIARRENMPDRKMSVEQWNELVDHFDVNALADQIKAVGAGYHIFTIGQNSGFYCSPNSAYDRIVGIEPSHCSKRDLIADLAQALHKRDLRLIVYLPSGAPSGDQVAREKLSWQTGPHRNREFQENWEQIIREWSARWGEKVDGWWLDGCYWPNTMYRGKQPPNFESFAAAARAGNPRSAIAFNPGVVYRTMSITPFEDYTGGEVDQPEKWTPRRHADGKADGAQIHMLSYLGERWGTGATPRFKNEEVVNFSRKVIDVGGTVTWDVPIGRDGKIAPAFIDQLAEVGKALSKPSSTSQE